jgi:hypothetical protein
VPPVAPSRARVVHILCSARHGDDEKLLSDFWPLFAHYDVDLVISGHSHAYQRFIPLYGVVRVIAGGGGHSIHEVKPDARLASWSEKFGFLMLHIEGARLTGEVWGHDGAQLDRFILEK